MAKTSLTESNASDYLSNKRYPRPLLVRALRWVLIKWWILPVIGLTIYLLLASFSHVLLNQLLFLMQHWWAILLSIFGLIVVGIAIRVSYQRAYDDAINEEREPVRRMHAEAEREGYPPGFHLRPPLQGRVQGREEIFQIAWSPDGHKLAAGSYGIIRLWNADSGAELPTLKGHSAPVTSVAWSPDGHKLVSGSDDGTIRLWNADSGAELRTLTAHASNVNSVAWSPDGRTLASGSWDNTVRLWNPDSGAELRTLAAHNDLVISVAWSPDGRTLASGSGDGTIRLWNPDSGAELHTLAGHADWVRSVAWFPKGRILASGSEDRTIRLWNPDSGVQIRILQGHTGAILSLSFSVDGRLLASKSMDGTVRLWRTDNWEVVAVLKEYYGQYAIYRPAFHPTEATTLATFGDESRAIRIWDLDVETLLGKRLDTSTVRYVNAKVVLVGDSGVGKTALCQVLTGGRFAPTESTHARKVWDFDSREVEPDDRPKEKRETLLWDLAGQPGYRPIHQWHLSEAALALVVFDSHSESEPFAGVRYWVRALRLAERAQRDAALHMKKFLVAARIDRGGKSVSRKRIDALLQELGFDDYFETSAKEVQNIKSLADTMRSGIRWDMLPTVTSSELFQRIQTFLVEEKNDGRQLSTFDDLYRAFLMKPETIQSETQDLRAQFDACVRLVQSQGLIRRLSFGNLVLLQPELLDAYAAALVNAVRNEPDGLGDILEDKVRACDFPMPEDERLPDREQEKLLLAAMVEDLLRYEIALQELSEDGQYLVFPAQSTRENPDLPDPEGKAVVFGFEGSVQNIYAALAVRLSHSGVFKKKDLWKDEMTFAASAGGTCGIILRDSGEGRGELTLFFDKAVGEETRFYFEGYVNRYLQGHAESISRRHIFVCSGCGFEVTDQLVKLRSERGFNWLDCPACHKRVSLLDREERLSESRLSVVQLMERAADEELERAIATSVMQGKITTGDFDVFLCHNGKDKPEVKKIGEKLKEHGILPWLDEWDLPPFVRWQDELQKVIPQMKAVAVFIGPSGVGPWEDIEMNASLVEFASRKIRIGLVLLPGCAEQPEVPLFMRSFNWVDFRLQAPDPMEQLIWGITGERKPIAKYKPVLAT